MEKTQNAVGIMYFIGSFLSGGAALFLGIVGIIFEAKSTNEGMVFLYISAGLIVFHLIPCLTGSVYYSHWMNMDSRENRSKLITA